MGFMARPTGMFEKDGVETWRIFRRAERHVGLRRQSDNSTCVLR